MAGGEVGVDPLFLGLTRPSMLFGVTYTYAAINGLVALMAFIVTENFLYLLVMLPVLHAVAYLICLKEPLTIELVKMRYSKCNVCRNRMKHGGTNSYDVY
ncbi:VirB3 family type IV secretion system protein [Pseudomonadota bacterium]